MERQIRRAFTLVELLVAITVLAILAALILVGLAAATQSAKDAKTRATIAKINAVVMAKYESYRTRRVPLYMHVEPFTDNNGNRRYDPGEPFVDHNGNGRYDGPRELAKIRLDALRELMRMEMPDRLSDIEDDPIALPSPPSVTLGYRSALSRVTPTEQYQGAECLYLFVMRGSDDPDISEQFATGEVGDVDGDGLNEFLDGWNRPISFLRWAPGFVSSLQPGTPAEHDPFDPLKVQAGTFPLYPLIYSAGGDGQFEVNNASTHRYAAGGNDPYALAAADAMGVWYDEDGDGVDGRVDNITNHE